MMNFPVLVLVSHLIMMPILASEMAYLSEDSRPDFLWLNTYADTNEGATVGVIHLQFMSKWKLECIWTSLVNHEQIYTSDYPGMRSHTQIDHALFGYYVMSTSFEWTSDSPLHDDYAFLISLYNPDRTFQYGHSIYVHEILSLHENHLPDDPFVITVMSMPRGFQPAYRFSTSDRSGISARLEFHMNKPGHSRLICEHISFINRTVSRFFRDDTLYDQKNAENVSLLQRDTPHGVEYEVSFSAKPQKPEDEVSYRCRMMGEGGGVYTSTDVLSETSSSLFPVGYDEVPQMLIIPDHASRVIRCDRYTTLPGPHWLKLMYNGRPVKILQQQQDHFQRASMHQNTIIYRYDPAVVENDGNFSCISETGHETFGDILERPM